MAVRSKNTILSAALLRTGNADDEGTALWRAVDANYDEIVRSCFEDGLWNFGKAREILTSRSDGDFGFDDAYVLPAEVITIIEVFFAGHAASDLLEPWELKLDTWQIMVNAGSREVAVEYVKSGLEYTWTAKFALAVQRRLEAVIKDVQEETGEASRKDQEADMQILQAGVKSSNDRSKTHMWRRGGGRLVRAKRGQY